MSWYEVVPAGIPITQGDLIPDYPVLGWKSGPIQLQGDEREVLRAAQTATLANVIVMTQACDLEHGKVENVILCPYDLISVYRASWEADQRAKGQNPTAKAWRKLCDDICDGYVWNLSILNSNENDGVPETEHRVVDFHEVFTTPRTFLESFLEQRGSARLRLLPPYREHLSQAFARFFMRVGLPVLLETPL